jgi:hypothetical protein
MCAPLAYNPASVPILKLTTRKSIAAIDLYAGAISETPRGGSTLGPTFTCLFAKQLYAFRRGDRLWYERQNGSNGFTSGKYKNIICAQNTSASFYM